MERSVVLWPRGGLWRHGDFLKLWSAETISQFGSQVSLLAIPLAAILLLHASAFEVAALGTIEFLPFLLFALPAGVWVDRLPRRPILVAADLGRAASLLSIPIVYGLGELTIWQLYAVVFMTGTLTVFFDVSYQSYLPSLVEREQLVEGNAKLEVSRSGAQIAGPGFAGALIGIATAPYAILVDAVSFVGSAVFVFAIRRREQVPERLPDRSMRRELWEGLRYLLGDARWRAVSTTTASSNFFSNITFGPILLVYAVRRLDLSAQAIGLVFALGNVGWLIGALLVGRFSKRLGVGRTIVGSALLFGPSLLLVPLAPRSFPIPVLAAGLALLSFGAVVYNIATISYQQSVTPERILGRLNASRRFIVWGTIPLGSLTAGVLASQIGLRSTLWVGAIGGCWTFLPVLLSPLRAVERVSEPAEVVAADA